jgi:arylsulfatase A-like enzyme
MNWPGQIAPGTVIEQPIHMVDMFPTLINLAGGTFQGSKPLDGKDIWATVTKGAASPHEDILINAEAFRGAIRKGDWKLLKQYTLPPKVELYNLATDPGETNNLAEQNPAIVSELEARLIQYGSEQKPSEWLKAQVNYLGAQSETATPSDLDAGPPGTETVLPES